MESNTRRVALHNLLKEVSGISNIYFQPPSNIKLKYPCIVYKREEIRNRHADDSVYNQHRFYQVTVIDSNPDSVIVDKISMMVNCNHVRTFMTEGLNHDVFRIYY